MLAAHPGQRRGIGRSRGGKLRRRRQAGGDSQRGAVEKIAAGDGGHPENLTSRVAFCPCRMTPAVLLDACRRSEHIELVPNAQAIEFEDPGDNVSVATADGRTFDGAALVAADGVRSLFRQKIIGDGEPRPVGYAALRTIVPMRELTTDVPRDAVVLWAGPGYHVVHYPLRHGAEFNIVAVFRTSTHAEKADAAAYRAELEQTYRDAHPAIRELNAMMDF